MVALLWITYFGIWITGTTLYIKDKMSKNIAMALGILSGVIFISLAIVDTRALIISTLCCLFSGIGAALSYIKNAGLIKGIDLT